MLESNIKTPGPYINEIHFQEGVTLPQLCQQACNDDSYYVKVARYNDLNKFRNLAGVQSLIFPPLIQPS